jgi:hypothetical protein
MNILLPVQNWYAYGKIIVVDFYVATASLLEAS